MNEQEKKITYNVDLAYKDKCKNLFLLSRRNCLKIGRILHHTTVIGLGI